MSDDAGNRHLRIVTSLGDEPDGRKPFLLTDDALTYIEAVSITGRLWTLNPAAIQAMTIEIRELRARIKTGPPKRIK